MFPELQASRQTTADVVFSRLYERIVSLDLMPGEKMSESEVAEHFGVSRQPVRDAFNRLGSIGLIVIQPQKATEVKKFSIRTIEVARFVRLSIELEIARVAAERGTRQFAGELHDNLEAQLDAARASDASAFHELDVTFHRLIANIAGMPEAFELALQKKAVVDRICVLSLRNANEMEQLVNDHKAIAAALEANDRAAIDQELRAHLSRIGSTIAAVQKSHAQYFEE